MMGIEHISIMAGRDRMNRDIGQRVMTTVAVVMAILLALALYGYFTGAWETPPLD